MVKYILDINVVGSVGHNDNATVATYALNVLNAICLIYTNNAYNSYKMQ